MARKKARKLKEKTRGSPAGELASALDSYLVAEPWEREGSMERLRAGLPTSLSLISKRLTREEGVVRERCTELLRRLGDPRAISYLNESLRDGFFSLGEIESFISLMEELGEEEGRGELARGFSEARSLLQELSSSPAEVASALEFLALPSPLRRALFRELLGRSEETLRGFLEGLLRARVLQEVPEVASDLAQALGRSESPRAPVLLRELLPSLSREAAREVRKALFRLKEKGLVVHEEREERPPPKPPAPYAQGFISAVDGLGGQIVIVARARKPLGRYLFQAHTNDSKGFLDFGTAELSAKDLRGYLTRIQREGPFPMVESPLSHCFRLLERARERSQGPSEALGQYGRVRGLISELVPEGEGGGHPAFELIGDLTEGEYSPDLTWEALLKETPFKSWYLEAGGIGAYVDELEEASESHLVLTPFQKRERLHSIYKRAAQELFSEPELRAAYAGRLLETAYFLAKRGKEAEGRLALEAFRELEAGGDAPSLFFRALVLKSIALKFRPGEDISSEGEKQEREGLIITPWR